MSLRAYSEAIHIGFRKWIAASLPLLAMTVMLSCVEAFFRIGEPFRDVGRGRIGVFHHIIHVLGHVMRLHKLGPTFEGLGDEFRVTLVAG